MSQFKKYLEIVQESKENKEEEINNKSKEEINNFLNNFNTFKKEKIINQGTENSVYTEDLFKTTYKLWEKVKEDKKRIIEKSLIDALIVFDKYNLSVKPLPPAIANTLKNDKYSIVEFKEALSKIKKYNSTNAHNVVNIAKGIILTLQKILNSRTSFLEKFKNIVKNITN